MRISDWSSDVCSSDLCASEITRIAFCRKVIALTMKNCAAGRFGVFVQSRLAACAYRMSRDPEELFPLSRTEIFISARSEEHTSELQSLMRISYAVFCLKTKTYIIRL